MHLNQSPIQEQRGHKGWPVETWTVGGSGGWKEERKNQESPMGRTDPSLRLYGAASAVTNHECIRG